MGTGTKMCPTQGHTDTTIERTGTGVCGPGKGWQETSTRGLTTEG